MNIVKIFVGLVVASFSFSSFAVGGNDGRIGGLGTPTVQKGDLTKHIKLVKNQKNQHNMSHRHSNSMH
jgi:hypothetical protein